MQWQWPALTQTRSRRIVLMMVVFVTAFVVASFWLPSKWRVQREILINAPPAVVFPYINSLKKWREWTVWYEASPDLPTEFSGPESGLAATSRWIDGDRRGAMKIMRSQKNTVVEYLVIFDGGEREMQGAIRLTPVTGGQTQVVWRAGGEAGPNPLQRYATLVMKYFIGRDFDRSLEKLRDLVETKNESAG